MPWPALRHMPDAELWAIAAYLKRGLKPQTNKVEPSEGPPDFWAGLYTSCSESPARCNDAGFPDGSRSRHPPPQ